MRKSKIAAIREYLKEEIAMSQRILSEAIKEESFVKASWVKGFKIKLETALALCGDEKPKEDKIE